MASVIPVEMTACEKRGSDEVVCHCLQIRRSEIKTAADQGKFVTVRCIMQQTDAGTGCTACHAQIRRILADQVAETGTAAAQLQPAR